MRRFAATAFGVGCLVWAASSQAALAQGELVGSDGRVLGKITAAEGPGGVLIAVTAAGLPPGPHGFHIHEVGACEPPFASAGGHYNPTGRKHGLLHPEGSHLGDLPNVFVGPDGALRAELFAPGVALTGGPFPILDGDGASMVLHEGPDDHRTDPAGASGGRIACAVLRLTP
ncbi:MAG: superoxide dismutase family protein [Deferrisomatales bacterium]|nr:superoxide dismutase family protein [Deferrisomatales bacterium]